MNLDKKSGKYIFPLNFRKKSEKFGRTFFLGDQNFRNLEKNQIFKNLEKKSFSKNLEKVDFHVFCVFCDFHDFSFFFRFLRFFSEK